MTINGLENVSRAQAALVRGTARSDSSHSQAGPCRYPSRPGGPQRLLSGIETERENEDCGDYHRTQANNVARGCLHLSPLANRVSEVFESRSLEVSLTLETPRPRNLETSRPRSTRAALDYRRLQNASVIP